MAKKNYTSPQPPADDNPFAALAGLGNLPPAPDNQPPSGEDETADPLGAAKSDPLRVLLDRKQRRGKTATIVTGFTGNEDALAELGKSIKVACGTGGSVKDGEIIIQGDHRERVLEWLRDKGFSNVKKSGG